MKKGLSGASALSPLHVLNGLVGRCGLQVPVGIVLERIDGCRIAEQVRLPLAGIAADKTVEIIEAHSVWPLIERPGLARLVRRRVVVFTEPRCCVPVLFQDCADGALVNRDYRVVAREPRRYFAHHAEAHRVMVTSRDDRRARRRAERRRMEIRVAQPRRGETIHCWCGDHPTKRPRRTEAAIIGHDQQNIRRPLRRDDAGRPPGCRLRCPLLDHAAEFRLGGRELVSADCRRAAGRSDVCAHRFARQCRSCACVGGLCLGAGKPGAADRRRQSCSGRCREQLAPFHLRAPFWHEPAQAGWIASGPNAGVGATH